GLRRSGPAVHGEAEASQAPTGDEAVRRPTSGRDALESPRGRARLDGLGARLSRSLGTAGGLRRSGRAPPRLPPPPAEAVRQVRLQAVAVRPLRPGLRPLPGPVRPVYDRGNPEVSRVHGRGGRPGDRLWRVSFWRAWRRPVPRRVAPEDVRREA